MNGYSPLRPVFIKPPFPWRGAANMLSAETGRICETCDFLMAVHRRLQSDSCAIKLRPREARFGQDGRSPLTTARLQFVDDLVAAWSSSRPQDIKEFLVKHEKALRIVEVRSTNSCGLGEIHYCPRRFLAMEIEVLCKVNAIHHKYPFVLRAIGTYVHFLLIHPFVDQNGRASRKLLENIFHSKGLALPVSELLVADRQRHNRVIHEFALTGDWVVLSCYFTLLLRAAGELALRRVMHARNTSQCGDDL